MATGDLSGFKDYASWQAANRAAGGSGENQEVANYFQPQQSQQAPAQQTSYNQYNSGGYGGAPSWQAPQQQQPARQQQAPASNVPGLMDYNTWYQKASAGQNWDPNDPENRAQYDQYVYTANGMRGGAMGGDSTDYSTGGGSDMYNYRGGQDEDYKRFSPAQLASWEKQKDSNCPPNAPYQAFDGSGCVQKPIESANPAKWGGTNGRGGGGGGGGRGGQGGQGGGYDNPWENGEYDYSESEYGYDGYNSPIFDYLKRTGLESAQDPEAALRTFMGYGGAQQFQQQQDAARAQVEAMPPGPARDAAMARLEESKSAGLAGMRQAAAGAARADLTGQLGTESGYAQLGENARQANMSNRLGWGNLGLGYAQNQTSRDLGFGNLALGNRQLDFNQDIGWAGLNQANQQFNQQLGFNRYATEGGWANNLALNNLQNAANQPTGAQKWLGGISAGLGTASQLWNSYNNWQQSRQK